VIQWLRLFLFLASLYAVHAGVQAEQKNAKSEKKLLTVYSFFFIFRHRCFALGEEFLRRMTKDVDTNNRSWQH